MNNIAPLILFLLAVLVLSLVIVVLSDDNTPASDGAAGGGGGAAGAAGVAAGAGGAGGAAGVAAGAAGAGGAGVAAPDAPPPASAAARPGPGGTNPQQAACAEINCNGTNRTKKSASEINAIPPTTRPDEYPDTTFRSPCCKWHDLPYPQEGRKNGINYTDFLNTTEACPIDDSNSNITVDINAGRLENGGNLCGGFTIQVDADSSTPSDILNDTGKFEINFIHDNPNRQETPSFRCPRRCKCPVFDSGQYWYKHHWSLGDPDDNGHFRCQNQ